MVEVITGKTKEEWQAEYKNYPSVTPDGFASFHEARVAPIAYEIPYGSKVLDVGANDGEFMKLLKEKRDCEVYGIDPSEVAIAKAKEKGIEVILGDAEHLPFEDNTFDYVTLNEVLIHLVDPVAVLKEIRRVLKPEGSLLGSAPHSNLEKFIWDDNRKHHRYLDEPGLRDLLEPIFPFCFVRTLNAAQFAVSMAQSFLADKPAELLFKCGAADIDDWEKTGLSDTKPRVWFGYTQLGGTVYYRMLGFAEKMDKLGLIQAAYERAPWGQIDEKSMHWQSNIQNKIILNQLDQLLRVAHLSVWQIVNNRNVIAFLRCAKDLANNQWFHATGERKAFITEIDDNIFDVPSYNIASHPYHPNSEMEWVANEQIKLSDALICSTQFLVDKIRAMYPDKPVYLVPNSLDFDIWDNVNPGTDLPKKEPGEIRIGYTGCSNHRGDLDMIKDAICAILKEFPHVKFILTPQPEPGGLFMGWEGVPNIGVVTKWVPIDEYPNFVAGWDLDIGVAPLRDNDFNRAKSNLRFLEYSALKVPTVASRVYPFKNSIRHGVDGIICNNSQEWYEALKSLIVDSGRRTQLGKQAYERVRKDFNMETTAKHYAEILRTIKCNVQISKPKLGDSLETPTTLVGHSQ